MDPKPELLRRYYEPGVTWKDVYQFNIDSEQQLGTPLDPWIKMEIPFEAADHPVFPSIEEVEETLTKPVASARYGKCSIRRDISPTLLQEAENMLFLQNNSQVKVPKVYAAFIRSDPKTNTKYYYVFQEHIEGERLSEEKWGLLKQADRDIICSKLSEQFRLLRAVPSEGYYGRVHCQAFPPTAKHLRVRYPDMCGPYSNYEEFVEAMCLAAQLRKAEMTWATEWHPSEIEKVSNFKQVFSSLKETRPTLTHLRPAFFNMIVRPSMDRDGQARDWEVTLTGWDSLGWYPEYLQVIQLEHWTWVARGKHDSDSIVTTSFPETAFTYQDAMKATSIYLFI